MHSDRPVDNWWTPARVRAMLARYPALCQCLDGLRATNLQPYESHANTPNEARFCDALQRKADLDRAIGQAAGRKGQAVHLRYRDEADEVNLEHDWRLSERQVRRILREGEDKIIEILCPEVSADTDSVVSPCVTHET